MTIAALIKKIRALFVPVEHVAEDVVHFVEKEITMSLPQPIQDAINAIKALVADHSAQNAAKDAQIADLNRQLDACKAADAQKDAAVSQLQAQLADSQSQLSDLEAQLLAIAGQPAPTPAPAPDPTPAPAPVDGSGSADQTP